MLQLVLLGVCAFSCTSALQGPNICTRQETSTVMIKVPVEKPLEIHEYYWCFSFPSKCRSWTRIEYKIQNVTTTRDIEECCEGYSLNIPEDRCVPKCSHGCSHGTCVAPNVCSCEPGYRGPFCHQYGCPYGFWGQKCSQPCDCHNGASCHPVTGVCECQQGFTGKRCLDIVPEERHGLHCMNGASYNPQNGECQCLPGLVGKNCSLPCPQGRYGMNCSENCQCSNGEECRSSDGVCSCKPGWRGPKCTEICPEGYFGDQCENICECRNGNFVCDYIRGCVCKNGTDDDGCDEMGLGRHSNILVVSIVTLLLVAMIVVFSCRRRIKNLKVASFSETASDTHSDELSNLRNNYAHTAIPNVYHSAETLGHVYYEIEDRNREMDYDILNHQSASSRV